MRVQRKLHDLAPCSGTKATSGRAKRHGYRAGSVEKLVPALAVATFLIGNSAAALGLLGHLSFSVAMPIIIACGIAGSLAAFCLISARLRDHDA
jgi:hypothetical protein